MRDPFPRCVRALVALRMKKAAGDAQLTGRDPPIHFRKEHWHEEYSTEKAASQVQSQI